MPPPRGLHTGIPTGQPNSTVLMSSPMRFRSSDDGSPFSHSRTGSPPASVRKKIAGTRFPCLSSGSGGSFSRAGRFGFLLTPGVYHMRYTWESRVAQDCPPHAGTYNSVVHYPSWPGSGSPHGFLFRVFTLRAHSIRVISARPMNQKKRAFYASLREE